MRVGLILRGMCDNLVPPYYESLAVTVHDGNKKGSHLHFAVLAEIFNLLFATAPKLDDFRSEGLGYAKVHNKVSEHLGEV
jgi:hypothetical protein